MENADYSIIIIKYNLNILYKLNKLFNFLILVLVYILLPLVYISLGLVILYQDTLVAIIDKIVFIKKFKR
jgi:hypothetical protein